MSEPSPETLERIINALCDGYGQPCESGGVCITDVHRTDAINCVMSGIIDIDGHNFGFVIEDGNYNGTVVLEWGDADEIGAYSPPEREPLTFIPEVMNMTALGIKIYLHWREQPWFKEKERAYNYDRFFQPGFKIEDHYRKWAAAKGMRIGTLEHFNVIKG